MKNTLLALMAMLVLLGASVIASAQQRNMVGILRMSSSADGCGCYFSFNKVDDKARRLMFFASNQDMGIWINIDGRDTRLRLVRETKPKGRIRVGSKFISHYAAGDLTVDLVQIATWVCPPRDEGCEITKYSATFTVRKGSRTQIVRAVGSCGC
jgi:hypothetical protein